MFTSLNAFSSFLAMDISSESLQLLEVKATAKGLQLQNYLEQPLPAGCVLQQRISDPSLFHQTLRQALQQFKPAHSRFARFNTLFHRQPTILALPVNQVITKTIPILSHLSHREVTRHIQQEILASLHTATPEVYWDFAYMPPSKSPMAETDPQEINIVIAQQASINPYIAALETCGLCLRAVDVESYALARAWRFCYPKLIANNTLHALLLLRAQLLTLVLVQGTRVLYARVCPIESTTRYDAAIITCIQQLWRTLPLNPAWPAIAHLWLAGECTQATYPAAFRVELGLPVSLVEFGPLFLNDPKSAHIPPTKAFLSCGLALWGQP